MSIERTYQTGVYIRLSREDGDDRESESVENQRDIIMNFINSNEDLEFVNEYVDDGYTGTNFDRPSFKRLIEDINKGIINCVITKDLSRFGRDHIDTGFYLERLFPSNNIRYIALGDTIDTKTSSGLNFMTFKLSFNDYYSLDISNKIKAVKHRKQEKGEYIAPYAPFGYSKDPNNKNHLIINEETAPIVRRIFDLYLNGMGTPKIAKILNDEKISVPGKYLPTERFKNCSNKWTKGNIYRLLKSEVYIGTIIGHTRYKVNHKVKTILKYPKDKWYFNEDKHEPIIDKKTFEKVQEKLKKGKSCRERKNPNPIKKYVYCGYCGGKATLKTHKRQVKSGEIHTHQYFICGRKSEDYHCCENGRIAWSVIKPLVEQSLKEECSKIVFSKGDLTSIYQQAKENLNGRKKLLNNQISRLEKEIQKIDKQLEQVYVDKIEGIIKTEDFTRFYNLYQEKKENNLIKVKELKKELGKTNSEKMVDYSYIKKVAEQYLNIDDLENNLDLLDKLIDRIEYFKGKKIKIKYKFTECK